MLRIKLFFILLIVLPSVVQAAKIEFIAVDTIYNRPTDIQQIHPYSINLSSSSIRIKKSAIKNFAQINNDLIYINKVKVEKRTYYRLALGNYKTQNIASRELSKIKKTYPSAWINRRPKKEISGLTTLLSLLKKTESKPVAKPAPAKPIPIPVPIRKPAPLKPALTSKKPKLTNEQFAEKIMKDARQNFIDENYTRVLAIAAKVAEIGTIEQRQSALELAGVVRERQNKIPQAILIYTEFLTLYPDSEIAPKVKSRLVGLKTMRVDPKKRLPDKNLPGAEDWYVFGSISQYYRNDRLEIDNLDSEEVNDSLVSDVNIFARKKTDTDALVLRFDGGLVNNFLTEEDDGRISRALARYTNNVGEYQIIGGRQSRTAKGVYGRFDGIVYEGLSHTSFDYSLYAGLPVQSSFDSLDSDRKFYGGSINFQPTKKLDIDLYLVQQTISDLTDREAIGTEFQYRADKGFLYGIIDYDFFYGEINNVTAISNYRYDDQWSFNITMDYRNSPLLTTLNAIQGQGVESIEELQNLNNLTDDQIYQLAEDRTRKSSNLFFGSSYQIDNNRHLYLSLSLYSLDATNASAATTTGPAIDVIPATDDIYLSADYSIRSFFTARDYTTFGLRLSDTSSSEIISFRSRFRIPSSSIKNLTYDPRLRIDYRQSKSSNDDQYILYPSFKISYKASKKFSFEGSLGIEYSDYELPERDDSTFYNLFLGYVYQF